MNPRLRPRRRKSGAPRDLAGAAGEAAELLRLLANEQRLLILCHLADGELSVGALQERLDLSQSALSQHLAKLREAGLVATRREAQAVIYSVPDGPVHRLMSTLQEIYCP